jgi:hypothetical protein
MKILPIMTAALLTCVPILSADQEKVTAHLSGPDLHNVLSFYKQASGLELDVSSQVEHLPWGIRLITTNAIPKSQFAQMIEKALREQAGVIITRLDDKTASVTYNDRLPAKPLAATLVPVPFKPHKQSGSKAQPAVKAPEPKTQ